MLDWRIIITLLLIAQITSLSHSNSYQYALLTNNQHTYNFKLQSPTRLTFLQQAGTAKISILLEQSTIATSQAPFWQHILAEKYVGLSLSVVIQGRQAIGRVDLSVVQQFQTVNFGEQKWVQIGSKQSRVFEIHPRRLTHLVIQKISGVAQFTNNRCKAFQKTDCYNQLSRLTPITMHEPFETVQIEYCSNCILLIKVESLGPQLQLRLHINATITLVDSLPAFYTLKQGQVAKFSVFGKSNFRGKVINFLGAVKLDSNLKVDQFDNGLFYQLDANHYLQNNVELSVIGLQKLNFFSIQTVKNELQITLKDGAPTTIRVQGGNRYTISFQHKNPGRGNFVLSGQTELMNRLSLHFVNKQTDQKYSVRPHYLFNLGTASQNFQLDNSAQNIEVQLRVVEGYGGYLNISANVNEPLVLPLDNKHLSILGFNEEDHYILQGVVEPVQLQITKCVLCHLQVQLIYDEQRQTEQILKQPYLKTVRTKSGTLSIIVKTNNYAYYSLNVAKLSKNQTEKPQLNNRNVSVYLSEPENHLLLQFHPPICGEKQCENVRYYIVEGSDARHVASRAYCPNSLFDFDERTKNIVFKEIQPTKVNQSIYSYQQPLVANDWVVLVAEAQNQILSYEIVNSGQIRVYKSMRWPIFYFSMFVTLAAFLSFVIFMGLRRRKNESSGYIRGSSSEQLD